VTGRLWTALLLLAGVFAADGLLGPAGPFRSPNRDQRSASRRING
jgi:hypothetical protein